MSLTTMRDMSSDALFYADVGFEEFQDGRSRELVGEEVQDLGQTPKHLAVVGTGGLTGWRCFVDCGVPQPID